MPGHSFHVELPLSASTPIRKEKQVPDLPLLNENDEVRTPSPVRNQQRFSLPGGSPLVLSSPTTPLLPSSPPLHVPLQASTPSPKQSPKPLSSPSSDTSSGSSSILFSGVAAAALSNQVLSSRHTTSNDYYQMSTEQLEQLLPKPRRVSQRKRRKPKPLYVKGAVASDSDNADISSGVSSNSEEFSEYEESGRYKSRGRRRKRTSTERKVTKRKRPTKKESDSTSEEEAVADPENGSADDDPKSQKLMQEHMQKLREYFKQVDEYKLRVENE
ncbi:hypothetical protein SJAG_00433 [Schizosaccharomyces japonicus yFS275]|uniref:Uncharacterized protein n=1 Tax=Schizosaccharomyces japonicus (strain yFS275 / FY16936) TaxID=402676 RepID=B6JVL8_SCHJY|nr:hypothetical protein SJAG_00433 [Schizosaccharomyces japonicus yFS275]EEB05419.1 hypothetical protein SJAG_00433 [Schizosaccharomyces japonicus yFS275]